MTDEEKAVEYAENLKARDFIAKTKEIVAYFAFLAGLKAGRPQWHDLRKDPTDLPTENKRYLCLIETSVGGANTYECSDYDTEYSSWKDSYGDVIKWKEIEK